MMASSEATASPSVRPKHRKKVNKHFKTFCLIHSNTYNLRILVDKRSALPIARYFSEIQMSMAFVYLYLFRIINS